MNEVVEILNAAGRSFVEFSLPMLIQSGVLILILLAVDAVLRRRVRAVFRYWIWMLVLIKLVLPPSLVSPVSVGTWFGGTLDVPMERFAGVPPARAEVLWPSVFEGPTPSTPAGKMPATQQPPVPESAISLPMPEIPAPVEHPVVPEAGTIAHPPALTWQGLLLLIWAVVAFALTLLLVQRAYFVRGLLGQSEEANRTILGELEDCRQRLGLRRAVALRLSPNATSPAVCGLLRPVILIPQSIAPRLQPQDLHAVLLHELAHVKRGDLWVNLIQTLLQIAYFYNPLLWLANAMIRRTREQAVDETVLVAMGEAAQQYPETLLNIAKLAFTRRPALSLRLIGVVESKSALTARIKHILTRPLPKTAKLGLAGLTAVAIIGAILLPMAKARPLPRPELDVVSPTEEQDRTVVEVPVSSDGVVTLPNGVTVEFLGLHDCGSTEDTWWRPDGEVLPEAPYGYSRYIRSMQPNQLYEVLFRISSPTGRTFGKMECARGRSHAPGFLHRDGGRRSRGLPDDAGDLFTGTLNRGSQADQVRIDIGVGLDNAWEPLGVLDGQASEAVTLADAVIEPARREGGKTVLTVTHRISDREVRLVAIDRNGLVHEPAGYGTRQGRGIVGYEPWFELSLAEVRQFRLEAQKLTWMAFENVSLRAGQKTEVRSLLPDGDRKSTGDAEPVAIAKLSNGAVVELVGIRDCAGGDESWWRPDGEALSVAPVDSSGGARGSTPKTVYEVLFRVDGTAGKAFAETRWNDGDRFVPGLVRGIRYGGRPDSDIPREADRLFSIMLHPRRGATEARIDVGVGLDNAWELLGSLDGRASNATVTVPGAVIQPAREEEGKTVVTVSHQFADRAVRLVALDRHGFIRQPTKHRYGRGDDGGICEATFGLPLAEIQEVRLEVQRLAWVTFQNVSLEAGKKTAVHVAVQSESSSDASVRAVVLPDVDREAKMLDLATGETLPLPQAGSPDEIWRAIGMLGRGDLVYDSNALILVREAVSDQAHAGPTPPFKTYDIKPPLPVALTVTTAEGARFEVTILAADERSCTLRYSRIPADRGADGEIGDLIAALRQNIRIAPGGESHNETVSSAGESHGASIYLPDLEKPGADTVLDLETRTFLSGEPMQRDPEYLDRLGKGDIAYEWANGKSGLLCFRGTRILEVSTQRPDGRQMTEAVQPDVLRREFEVYFIDAPRRYRMATARGEEYELNVISIDKGDSGGALVEIAKVADSSTTASTGGVLEFRIAPRSIDLEAGLIETLKQMRTHGGGLAESDFAWFPIRMDLTGQPFAITHEFGGKAYVLLCNKPPHVILASQDWGLESVYRVADANRRPAIGLTFNDKGASLFHDLTAAHVQQNLAIVVEGTVVAMPNISAPLGRAAIITGNFTEQEIEVLLAVLRKNVGRQPFEPGATQVLDVVGGEWTDLGEAIPPDANDTRTLAPGVVLDGIGEDVEGKVFVASIRDLDATAGREYRFVIRWKDGRVQEPQYRTALDRSAGGLWEKFTFDAWYNHRQIESMRLQSRPVQEGRGPAVPSPEDEITIAAGTAKPTPSTVAPPGRYALAFDGKGDYLYVPDSESLRAAPSLTIEVWIKPQFGPGPHEQRPGWGILARGAYTGTGRAQVQGFALRMDNFDPNANKVLFDHCQAEDDGIHCTGTILPVPADWLHLSRMFYSRPVTGHPLVFGRFLIPSDGPFCGQIAEIRVWDGRKDSEAQRLAGSPLTGNESGLVACWTFEEGGGQIVHDISPNANHARLGSSVGEDDADPTWVDLSVDSR